MIIRIQNNAFIPKLLSFLRERKKKNLNSHFLFASFFKRTTKKTFLLNNLFLSLPSYFLISSALFLAIINQTNVLSLSLFLFVNLFYFFSKGCLIYQFLILTSFHF